MSLEMLRNVVDGSVQEIDTNSDEYAELINEMYDHDGSARPKYELTGQHHVRKLDEGNIDETDFGYAHKPVSAVVAGLEDLRPNRQPSLTQAEVEMGITSHDDKMSSIQASHSPHGTLGHTADRPVESLERSPVEDRLESGREAAGRSGRSGRKRTSRSKTAAADPGDTGSSSGAPASGSTAPATGGPASGAGSPGPSGASGGSSGGAPGSASSGS